jgi:tetratricopeptide (TPR) repeat protein
VSGTSAATTIISTGNITGPVNFGLDERTAGERHRELMDAISREKGIPIENLATLFEAVGEELPERDFETAVRTAVEALIGRSANPVPLLNDPAEIQAAIETARCKLRQADSEGAVEHLRRVRRDRGELRQSQSRADARLAMEEAEILKVSFRWDDAILAYEAAAALDPHDAWPWFAIGDIRILRTNRDSALTAFEKGKAIAEGTGHKREVSVALNKIGSLLYDGNDPQGSLNAYEQGLEIRRRLLAADPSNTQSVSDFFMTQCCIADLYRADNNLPGALKAYEEGIEAQRRLMLADPSHLEWARNVSITIERIGVVRRDSNDLPGALKAFEECLEMRKRLLDKDPSNEERERDVSVALLHIGDVCRARNDFAGALSAYENALETGRRLMAADPSHPERSRDVSVSINKIGDVLAAREDLSGALKAYRESLKIRRRLMIANPSHTGRSRDVFVNLVRIGVIQRKSKKKNAACECFKKALSIIEPMASDAPNILQRQTDLQDVKSEIAKTGC